MSHEAIATVPRGPRMSIRRLLGLHEHDFSAWTPHWATPEAGDRMTLLTVRECATCRRVEFRRETMDVPPSGFPHHLHMGPGARSRG